MFNRITGSRRQFSAVVVWTVAIGIAAVFGAAVPARAADPNPAVNEPDRTAWTLFTGIVPYRGASGGNDAVFETWAGDPDTFSSAPAWPPSSGAAKKLSPGLLGRGVRAHRATSAPAPAGDCVAHWRPGEAPCIAEEVRRNRAAFEFIVQTGIYTQAGLAAFYDKPLAFPTGAIEVKADWIPVSELQSWNGTPPDQADTLYHVNAVAGPDGKPIAYALVALHIMSKQVPNWTWATFEHWRNPGRCDEIGCHDLYGAATAHVPPNAKPLQGYSDCAKSGALLAQFSQIGLSPVWQNYCLKGTQSNYVTNTGKPVALGNSVIEGLNAGLSPVQNSCMTCHATAAFNGKGMGLAVGLEHDLIGAPQPDWFGNGASAYRQADFDWSIPLCAVPTGGTSACALP
jgi:hypothetical protein